MSKHLHAVEFDGTTFGMEIETNSSAYRKFKSQVKLETAVLKDGAECKRITVPYLYLAALMHDAHWLVSEQKLFDKIAIDDFYDGKYIFVKYTDVLDFGNRFGNDEISGV